jgi:hypothetical protein
MPSVRNSESALSPAEPLNPRLFPASSLAAEMQTAGRSRASTRDTLAHCKEGAFTDHNRSLILLVGPQRYHAPFQ